jgi:hypothetical protein
MRFVVRPGIVLVAFWFNSAAAQEGYLGHDHDKWHRGFYQTLLRPDTKTPCCSLRTVALPQGDWGSMATTK